MRRNIFIVFIFYLFLVGIVFQKALFPGFGQLIYGDDIHHQYYFFREFFNSFLRQGIFPLWNPYLFSGMPFNPDPIANLWYLPTWLYVFLPLSSAYILHLTLHIVWAMTGMYFLISNVKFQIPKRKKKFLQMPDVGALVGGAVFGLSGFFMARTWAGHTDVIAAASWMPWVIATFWKARHGIARKDALHASGKDRFQRGIRIFILDRWTFLAGIVFGLQLLAGYHTMAFFTLEILGVIVLTDCFLSKSVYPFFLFCKVSCIGIGLSAIQILPEMELMSRSVRSFVLPYDWASYGSITFQSLKQLISPFFYGDQFSYTGPPPNYIEHAMYLGRVSLGVLLYGVFVHVIDVFRNLKKNKPIYWIPIVFLVLALFGLWVSLGPNAPVDLQKILWTFIPLYHSLRIPPRHLILFVFGASTVIGLTFRYFRFIAFKGIIGFFVIGELLLFGRHFIELRQVPEARQDQDLVRIITKNKTLSRLLPNFGVWVPTRESLEFDSAMSNRFFSPTGYDVAIIRTYYEFIDAVNGNTESSIRMHDVQVPYLNVYSPYVDYLNITYILVPRAYDPIGGNQSGRFTLLREDRTRDYRLYRNNNVLPRYYLVSNVVTENNARDILHRIQEGKADLKSTVYLEKNSGNIMPRMHCPPNATQEMSETSVRVERYTPNEIVLTTSNSCDAYLVSSEVYYPGWSVYVDNRKTDLLKGNYTFRTLFIPSGNHTITFRFFPISLVLGALISVLSAGCVIVFLRKK